MEKHIANKKLEKRFLDKVNKNSPGDCWDWTAGKYSSGHGAFGINKRTLGAHRVSWEIYKGTVPDGMFVLHKCDNPGCVNPAHLFLGTSAKKETLEERFWPKVDKRGPDECWEWQAGKDKDGYGNLWKDRKQIRAHRVSWLLHTGNLPEEKTINHKCGNPSCVNPSHLFVGDDIQMGPFIERFWGNVEKGGKDECWEWIGLKISSGYGHIRKSGKKKLAHRLSWEMQNGPIPDGLLACHHCDNPSCVNPHHIFLGTHKDNAIDMVKKGRGRNIPMPGEKNGMAKLTAEKVRALRYGFEEGYFDLTDAARIFKVSKSTVRDIVSKRRWKHIT